MDANCASRHAVQEYLRSLATQLDSILQPPAGFNRDGYLELRLALHADGSIANQCLFRSSSRILATEVLQKLEQASFPPVPLRARCLAGAELVRSVTTVERD